MKIRLRIKKEPPDGWLVIWSKEAGRKTALHVKLSFLRSHTPEELRQIWQERREYIEKYHESKRRFPDQPQKWYGHPYTKGNQP